MGHMATMSPLNHSMRQYDVPKVSHLRRCQHSRSAPVISSFATPFSSLATGWPTFSLFAPSLTTETGRAARERAVFGSSGTGAAVSSALGENSPSMSSQSLNFPTVLPSRVSLVSLGSE